VTALINIDEKRVAPALEELGQTLDGAEGEVWLDFSSVNHVDSKTLGALKDVARVAEEKRINVTLLGVNVDVYKVLKLVELTRRFSFLN
jgi:anti-anti-sigma regulatory factor